MSCWTHSLIGGDCRGFAGILQGRCKGGSLDHLDGGTVLDDDVRALEAEAFLEIDGAVEADFFPDEGLEFRLGQIRWGVLHGDGATGFVFRGLSGKAEVEAGLRVGVLDGPQLAANDDRLAGL